MSTMLCMVVNMANDTARYYMGDKTKIGEPLVRISKSAFLNIKHLGNPRLSCLRTSSDEKYTRHFCVVG